MFGRLSTHASSQTARPHEVNITIKNITICVRGTFSSVLTQEYTGFSNDLFLPRNFKNYEFYSDIYHL